MARMALEVLPLSQNDHPSVAQVLVLLRLAIPYGVGT